METKVVVGAEGYNNNPGWLHTNEDELNLLKRETWLNKFQPNSLSVILAEHVWEHLSYEEGIEAAKYALSFYKMMVIFVVQCRMHFSPMKNISVVCKWEDLAR